MPDGDTTLAESTQVPAFVRQSLGGPFFPRWVAPFSLFFPCPFFPLSLDWETTLEELHYKTAFR